MKTTRSRLSDFAEALDIRIVRDCDFTYAAKILSPIDDLVVPLTWATAAPDLTMRNGIAGVLTTPALAGMVPSGMGLALTDDPMRALDALHRLLHDIPGRLWTDFPSQIDPAAVIHPGAVVAPMKVRIGKGAEIRPLAYVAERTVIGAGLRVHVGAVIGADAYELLMLDGRQVLRPQSGGVVLGEDVEVMSGAVVARAAFGGATHLGDRAVLDANVVVSHDAELGQDVRAGGGAWIGGRAVIGDFAALGPSCVIGNGLKVGARARVSMGAVVTRDVADDAHFSGKFAVDHQRFLAHLRAIR